MHPDLADLLTLRDEARADDPLAGHVATCVRCRAELERLEQLRKLLRAAPDVQGDDHWPAVAARLGGETAPVRALPRPTWRAAAAVCGALAIAAGLAFFKGATPTTVVRSTSTSTAVVPTQVDGDLAVAELMEESKRLERLLAAIPDEPRVARGATVMTAAGLEDRIEWLDLAIGAGVERDIDAQAVAPLWRQRVDLMHSLVAVRYAEARTTAY